MEEFFNKRAHVTFGGPTAELKLLEGKGYLINPCR